jgi:hypothetical protein
LVEAIKRNEGKPRPKLTPRPPVTAEECRARIERAEALSDNDPDVPLRPELEAAVEAYIDSGLSEKDAYDDARVLLEVEADELVEMTRRVGKYLTGVKTGFERAMARVKACARLPDWQPPGDNKPN